MCFNSSIGVPYNRLLSSTTPPLAGQHLVARVPARTCTPDPSLAATREHLLKSRAPRHIGSWRQQDVVQCLEHVRNDPSLLLQKISLVPRLARQGVLEAVARPVEELAHCLRLRPRLLPSERRSIGFRRFLLELVERSVGCRQQLAGGIEPALGHGPGGGSGRRRSGWLRRRRAGGGLRRDRAAGGLRRVGALLRSVRPPSSSAAVTRSMA